jgi:hypothetical protein
MEHTDFLRYANDVGNARLKLAAILAKPGAKSYFYGISPTCLLAVQYELPCLLVEPLYHFRHYVETLEVGGKGRGIAG